MLAGCSRAETPQPPELAPTADQAWVELTDRGAQARLITATAACPAVALDGKLTPMTKRVGPSAEFPLTVCQLPLPKGVRLASVRGIALPVPIAEPHRVLIFGDTGCRLKGSDIQNCDDPKDWPFGVVSRLAAAHHPDLVVHVGDYYYRESPCPAGRAGCAGSPWGDNWNSWNADFFQPAEPLLRAAPWVMVRGNHEDCQRGGPGWFMLLDASASPLTCPAESAPMKVDVGGLQLYVLDSADTVDRQAPPDAVAAFSRQLDLLKTTPPTAPAWIITHRPIWGMVPTPVGRAGGADQQHRAGGGEGARPEGRADGGQRPHPPLRQLHVRRPAAPQLIVGNGGDVGELGDSPRFLDDNVSLDGMSAKRFGFDRYGFLILEKTGDDWAGSFYDVRDHPIASCRLAARALTCQAIK
ncbi:MAG: metallophosphoesterase [Caulobacteraceae bacterium]